MLPIVIVLLVLVLAPILGNAYLRRGKARSIEAMANKVKWEIAQRLEAIAGYAEGKVVEGTALETKEGRLAMAASAAPESWVIDACQFTGQGTSPQALTIVPAKDEAKVLQTKVFHAVAMDEAISSTHRVFSSDEAFARAVVTPDLVAALRAMDSAARLRSRVDLSPRGIAVVASRAPEKEEELLAFYNGCVAALALIRPHLAAR